MIIMFLGESNHLHRIQTIECGFCVWTYPCWCAVILLSSAVLFYFIFQNKRHPSHP